MNSTLKGQQGRTPRWRFSLAKLLVVPIYIALLVGLARWQGFIIGLALYSLLWISWLLWQGRERTTVRVLRFLAGYGALSIATLPLLDSWWIGELPVWALVQLPKIELANRVRHFMVMHLMGPLGLSHGSYSPDWSATRPYALTLVYLTPLIGWLIIMRARTHITSKIRTWILIVLALALVDYVMILACAGGPGLSVY